MFLGGKLQWKEPEQTARAWISLALSPYFAPPTPKECQALQKGYVEGAGVCSWAGLKDGGRQWVPQHQKPRRWRVISKLYLPSGFTILWIHQVWWSCKRDTLDLGIVVPARRDQPLNLYKWINQVRQAPQLPQSPTAQPGTQACLGSSENMPPA